MAHEFIPGQFEKFRALHTFHLGAFALDVRVDSEFEYDGSVFKYLGKDYQVPQLQGAYDRFYVPVADQKSTYKAQPSGIKVRPADAAHRDVGEAMSVETHYEEVEVGTLAKTAAKREGRAAPLPVDAPDGGVEVVNPRRMQVEAQDEVDVTPARMNPKAAAARQAAQAARRVIETAQVVQAVQALPPGMGAMQAQLMASGAYQKLSAPDQEAVMRADAANSAALAAALAVPVPKARDMGGNRHDSLGDEEETVAVGQNRKHRLIRYDGQQGEVVRTIRDTGGAAVGQEGQAVQEVRGVNMFSTTGEAILSKAVPIGGTPRAKQAAPAPPVMATGAGPNRAVTVDQVGPKAPRQKTARSTQVPAEGNTDIRMIHASGATGDAAEDTSGDDLTELLPDAAVACPPSDTAERAANAFLKTNAKLHWATRAKTAVAQFQDRPDVLGLICKKDKPGVGRLIQDLLRS